MADVYECNVCHVLVGRHVPACPVCHHGGLTKIGAVSFSESKGLSKSVADSRQAF